MSSKIKALMSKTAVNRQAQEKFAEESLLQGQLIGKGFNYEVFEKEGAPLREWYKVVKGKGGDLVKAIGRGASKTKGAVGKGLSATHRGAGNLGGRVLKRTRLAGKRKAKLIAGYGIPSALLVGGAGGSYAAVKHHKNKKTKEASEKVASVSADNLILRFTEGEE